MKKITRALVVASAICALATQSALAAVPMMGQLSDILPPSGENGAWSAQTTDFSWTLTNVTDPGDLQYFYLNPASGEEGSRKISVTVKVTDGSEGGAGLLYGFNPETRFYFLLVMQNDELVFYRRDATGLNMMLSTATDAIMPGFNTLNISENGAVISIGVNGTEVGTIENDVTGKGAVGGAAFGTGEFAFRDCGIAK